LQGFEAVFSLLCERIILLSSINPEVRKSNNLKRRQAFFMRHLRRKSFRLFSLSGITRTGSKGLISAFSAKQKVGTPVKMEVQK